MTKKEREEVEDIYYDKSHAIIDMMADGFYAEDIIFALYTGIVYTEKHPDTNLTVKDFLEAVSEMIRGVKNTRRRRSEKEGS